MSAETAYILDCLTLGAFVGTWLALGYSFAETVHHWWIGSN